MLLILVVLSSGLAGSRDKSRQSVTEAGGGPAGVTRPTAGTERKQGAKPAATVSRDGGGVRPIARGGFEISGAGREGVEAKLFSDPPAPLLRTARVATSSALAARPNNGGGEAGQDATQAGNFQQDSPTAQARGQGDEVKRKPREERLTRAHTFNGDLRNLPHHKPVKRERPEREEPEPNPTIRPGAPETPSTPENAAPGAPVAPSAPAPATTANFDGLDFANWGAGHPPDTNGDVGPVYYIQTVNTSIGIFDKSNGNRVAAFTFNDFMSQGHFGNLCDTNNFGDPVVLYDTLEDRWIITDFAFQLDGSNNVVNPPGSFQCFAASKTSDPVAGGWNFYSINTAGGLGDYPKFGIWPDGLYMSVNMFGYAAGAPFQGSRVYALNKAQMYAGAPSVQVVSFDAPSADFTLLPSNARLQAGTPPAGTPDYFVSSWEFLNALTVYKFHVDWDRTSLSTFTGPDVPTAATSWPNASVPNAPSSGGNNLDVLQIRAMMQNQYTNLSGVESLWATHTVRRQNTSGFAAPRWYELHVTGGTVAANITQAATFDPDGANVIYRFMPSLAVDRAGDMALGYSTSSSTTKPAIKYAGRLSTDPVNTLGQTEQLLIQGTGTQVGNCGGSPCTRWGDYSAMSLDPDGCTFWYTNEYYGVDGLSDLTRIGSFAFPQCTPVGSGGTVSGTVTDNSSNPLSGATVALGSRTTTTNASGFYSFTSIPAGTYPSINASAAGYGSSTATSVVVTDGGTTTENFSLTAAPSNACPVDTSQSDFQLGVATNVDLTTSPGDIILLDAPLVDQQNTTLGNSGVGITTTTYGGQTFTPAVTGKLTKVDINLFCSGCTGTTPNLTLSVRNTSGGLPTGADLASATINGFSNGGVASYFTATFAAPLTLTAGTQYALVIRPVANPSPGVYALTRSGTSTLGADVYAGGTRVSGATSGTAWSIPLTGGVSTDAGFRTYMDTGFASSGNLISGVKDANPSAGSSPSWSQLSWTATTPANTGVQFQAAASNNASGPFNFVGPDGTASTFFTTSGASLSQFNGFRYLKYKALLSTSDSTATPTLNDVTACFVNITFAAAAPLSRQQGSAPTNGQIATVSDPTQSANTLSVTATPLTGSGVNVGNISVDASGHVTADVSAGCAATNSTFTLKVTDSQGASASTTLTVNVSANDAPALTYNNAALSFGGATTINPATGPTDNGSASVAVQSTGTYTGGISVNNATGVISITNAAPVGAHTITIRATDNCNVTTDSSFTLTVNKADQTINVGTHAPSGATYNTQFTVAATATSSLAVAYTSAGACTNTGATFTMTSGTGTCTVKYDQAGDGSYNAATQLTETVNAQKAAQTINFGALPTKTFGDADFGVSATATSNLAVGFAASGQCMVSGGTVHITGAGSCTVTASQAGDSNYSPATSVDQSFTINKAAATVTLSNLSQTYDGNPKSATATTGPAGKTVVIAYSQNSQPVASPTNAGSYDVSATINDANYQGSASGSLTINKAGSTTTVTVSNATFDNSTHGGTATVAGAGGLSQSLTVNYTGRNATVYNSTTAPTNGGDYTAAATFNGDANHNGSNDSKDFQIAKAAQTINFGALSDRTFGDPDFTLSATASSGLGVSFAAAGVCTLSGGNVHLTGAGQCKITASQAGDGNYNAATSVEQSFQVGKAASATALASSANPSALGQSVTFTATVTTTVAAPTGTVQFKADGNNLGGAGVCVAGTGNTCTAQAPTSGLTAGAHTITADYSGDSNFNASSGSLSGEQAVGVVVEFSQATYTVAERAGSVTITVRRTGDATHAASVDYATDDGSIPSVLVPCSAVTGLALERCDYTRAAGTLSWAAGDASDKTFNVLVNDDSYAEGIETLSLKLSNPGSGAALGTQSSATLQITDDVPESSGNPVDDDQDFVTQQYHDFLGREPDAAGLKFWTDGLKACGADQQCRAAKRVDTSAAFFLSIEFQQTGFFAYRVHKAAFGDIGPPQVPVPVRIDEFLRDTQQIGQGVVVGQGAWQQKLEANKQSFALAFVQRGAFQSAHGAQDAAAFVDSLFADAGVTPTDSERDAAVAAFGGGGNAGQAAALRSVAESASVSAKVFNESFVLLQYFGYLRRDPDAAPDVDYGGYRFWLDKLNRFGDFRRAEMVRAFITSAEYRQRFGQ
jgi:hypothetical protein